MPDWSDLPLLSNSATQRADDAGNILNASPIDAASTFIDPRYAEWVQLGVMNGAFERGPNDETNNIEDEVNPLPDWTGPVNVSGGAITCSWVDDSSGSAKNLRFTMAAGAAADEAYVEQIVRIPHSKAYTIIPTLIAYCPTSLMGTAGNASVFIEAVYLQSDGVTTTGAADTTLGDSTLTLVNAGTGNLRTRNAIPNTTGVVPLDAAFVRIRVGLRRDTAATTDTGGVDITDVRLRGGDIELTVTDDTDSVTYGYGLIQQTSGQLRIKPANLTHSGPEINLYAAGIVAGDIFITATSDIKFQGGAGSSFIFESLPLWAPEIAAPGTPTSGFYAIYAKTDGILYGKNDAGTEVAFGGSGTGKTVIRPSISGTVNNWNPTGLAHDVVILADLGGANRIITGISALADGAMLYLMAQSSTDTITLSHLSGSSSAANQFRCPAGANYVIGNKAGVTVVYDATDTKWRVVGQA